MLEGSVHVPAVVWWPGVVEPNRISGDMIHVTDFYSTAAKLTGVQNKIPNDRVVDGIEQSSLLLAGNKSRRNFMFHYSGSHVRWPWWTTWKSIFDVYKDPKEENGVMVSMLWA